MPFEAADRLLTLRRGQGSVEGLIVNRVKPHSSIAIDHPVAKALRITELGLEGPAIDSPVDELRSVVLPSGRNDLETGTQDHFLLPLGKFLRLHRRPAL